MAEIVAFGAGVIAFIQLTDRVIQASKFYLEAIHGCPHDIKVILVEISSLKGVLQSVNFLSDVDSSGGDSSGLVDQLVRDPATKRWKTEALIRQLAWPLKKSEASKLLAEISRYKAGIVLTLTDEASRDIRDIKANLSEIRKTLTHEEHQRFCMWIEHTNPTRRHNESCELREPHTGGWAIRSPEWQSWIQGSKRFLWIHGIPGAGKTVLTSCLIEEAKKTCRQSRQAVVYYYCHFVRNQNEAKPLLRWLIGQLCRRSGVVPSEIMSLFKLDHEPNFVQLLAALESVLEEFERIYFVIDAVDESLPRETLIKVIRDLATDQRFQNIRLLAISREYIDIETTFSPVATALSMENDLVAEDIRVYARATLRSCPEFARWTQDLLSEVEEALVTGAKGMFRWAFCQVDSIRRLRPHEARKALKTLPKTLDETYERIFLGLQENDCALVRNALALICDHQDSGIKMCLPAAILLKLVAPASKGSNISAIESYLTVGEMRGICGCLLAQSTDKNGDVMLDLAHYTVKEYLYSDRMARGPATRFALSESVARQVSCRVILAMACQAEGWSKEYARKDVTNLGPYCVSAMTPARLKDCEDDALIDRQLQDLYFKFLDPSRPSWDMLILRDTHWPGSGVFSPIRFAVLPENLDAAVFINMLSAKLFSLARQFLSSRDIEGILYQTAIHLCRHQGGVSMYPDDLTTGRNIMDHLREWPGLFGWNIVSGDDDDDDSFLNIVRIAADLCGPPRALALYVATQCHSDEKDNCGIRAFLSYGADLNAQGQGITPLQIAVYRLDVAAVEEMLELGADPDGTGDPGSDRVLSDIFNEIPSDMTPLNIVKSRVDLLKREGGLTDIFKEAAVRIETLLQ